MKHFIIEREKGKWTVNGKIWQQMNAADIRALNYYFYKVKEQLTINN